MKLDKIFEAIKSKSTEEHEKLLRDKMMKIELEYVNRLLSGQIKPFDQNTRARDIKFLLKEYTEIEWVLWLEYEARRTDNRSNENQFNALRNRILDEITQIYKQDPGQWLEKTEQLLKDEINKMGEIRSEERLSPENDKNRAGLLHFGISQNWERLLQGSKIKDGDYCLDIHFEPLFKQSGDQGKNLFSLSSLEKLAIKIVDEHPEVKAIVAQSWLMDTPIAKRIGFTTYDSLRAGQSSIFWGQFVKGSGQIDDERVSKFLETGIPPYKVMTGAIMTEDFLKKYLPKDRRGKIILKDVVPGFEEELKKERENFKHLGLTWDKMTPEALGNYLVKTKIFRGFFETSVGREAFEYIKELKRRNMPAQTVNDDPKMADFRHAFNVHVESIKYTKREVIID